jgi:hypothetical protein
MDEARAVLLEQGGVLSPASRAAFEGKLAG